MENVYTGSSEYVMIGNSFYGNNHLYGSLNDLRIYEKPLDGDQIAELAGLDSESEIQYNTDGAMEYDGTNRYTYNSDGSPYGSTGFQPVSYGMTPQANRKSFSVGTSWDTARMAVLQMGYVYADGAGAPVAVEDSAGNYDFIATDPQGNVIYQAHSSSYIVLVKYDAYGNVYNTSAGDLNLPFRFAGMRYEKDADIYLTPNRAYSPALGRWLQVDQLGTLPNPKQGNRFAPASQYTDGQNLYEYCGGDPVNESDLRGLVCGSWGNDWIVADKGRFFDFTEACQEHDNCYDFECYLSKKDCDNQFLENMNDSCENTKGYLFIVHSYPPHYIEVTDEEAVKKCREQANLYFRAVNESWGGIAWLDFHIGRSKTCNCRRNTTIINPIIAVPGERLWDPLVM